MIFHKFVLKHFDQSCEIKTIVLKNIVFNQTPKKALLYTHIPFMNQ